MVRWALHLDDPEHQLFLNQTYTDPLAETTSGRLTLLERAFPLLGDTLPVR